MAEDRKKNKTGTYASQRDRRRRVIAEFRSGLVLGENGRPYHPDPDYPHGSPQTYNFGGCRCQVCCEGAHDRYVLRRDRKPKRLSAQRELPVEIGSIFDFTGPETTDPSEG